MAAHSVHSEMVASVGPEDENCCYRSWSMAGITQFVFPRESMPVVAVPNLLLDMHAPCTWVKSQGKNSMLAIFVQGLSPMLVSASTYY